MALYILFLLLLCEGLGLFLFHSSLPFVLALIPSFILLYHIIRFNKFHISFSLSSFFLGCTTVLYAVSIINSINKEASIESILIYVALYLFYLYFSSHPIKERKILQGVYILCTIFIGGFLFFSMRQGSLSPHIVPQTEYQFVASFFRPHNHLGDFLGLGMVVSLYFLITTSQLRYYIPMLIFLPFVLISFSNSAYLSITLTFIALLVFAWKKYHFLMMKILIASIILFLIFALLFIGSTKESEKIPLLYKVQQYITKTFSFSPKLFGSTRISYFSQALEGIKRSPLYGIGPNNFSSLSKQLTKSGWEVTSDAHNIFLELGVEAGLPALMLYIAFMALRVRRGIINPSLPFFIFLYLLFNFQSDYTYKIYSLLLLFIVSASQIERQNQDKKSPIGTYIFVGITLLLQVAIIGIVTSLIFQKIGQPAQALFFNPFNRYAYYDLLKDASLQKDARLIEKYAASLRSLSKINLQSELEIVKAYQSLGEPKKLLEALESAYRVQPLIMPTHIEQLYILTKKYRSSEQAIDTVTSYIRKRKKAPYYNDDKNTRKELIELCKKTYEEACRGPVNYINPNY